MPSFQHIDDVSLRQELDRLVDRYEAHRTKGYSLKMVRGVPCSGQLDLSEPLDTILGSGDYLSEDGTDCRNYGGLEGIPEARRLFSEILRTRPENVLVFGNSSLNLMFDTIVAALLSPVPGAELPWSRVDRPAFLCPSPGYDRHFAITQRLGFENIAVPMTPTGPDMDTVERLAASDPRIKGIWCVPVYSNPDGIVYEDETCRRLAAMPAAPDFRIFWDNAYGQHHLYPDRKASVPDILGLCAESGHPDRVYEFTSTSKITYAGAGVSCMAASPANIAYRKGVMFFQTIGHDKLNQLRHVRFLKDLAGVERHMERHAGILRPKFEAVLDVLDSELSGTGIARWNRPLGGYFISLFVYPGTAAEVVETARACGVEFTPAGATYPGGIDPEDSNIRIAPTFPPVEEVRPAAEVLCICAKMAAIRRILRERALA
ncbi:MAG: aminotransferase class I/II-fold pyridoxal phosphate-dependent enzyme [Clostridia bacterium]|nr:aminotransferase class I/II-fold pyridoxal phosphate-dependent enzyme [Clostridia bacterium]